MREDICIIPINDVFLPKDGCPICRMHDMLEARGVEYITGSAMMEPDVRIKTNEKGFCFSHFQKMLTTGKRLPNGLLVQSHLDEIQEKYLPLNIKGKPDKKQITELNAVQKSCFICEKIEKEMEHMRSIIFSKWQSDPDFKALYSEQETFCLSHYVWLMDGAINKGVSSKILPEFYSTTATISGRVLKKLREDIAAFCGSYDYKNSGCDVEAVKDSIERSIEFLTGKTI
ncbi:MAG: DUF6062 family protein [Bacillota bacterium]|nr:DUF6062 family protein [Bacillota bacterium]